MFTSGTTATFAENASTSVPVYKAVATDPEGAAITYSIGGDDVALFGLNQAGEIYFNAASPDFENPLDRDKDNIYRIEVGASDGVNTTKINVAITVTDVAEGIRLQVVANFSSAMDMTALAAGPATSRIFAGQNTGQIYFVDSATTAAPRLVFTAAAVRSRSSTNLSDADYYYGVLGMIAAPDYATSGVIYVLLTSTDRNLELRRYRLDASASAVVSTELILRTPIPTRAVVNGADALGGGLAFGADGYLYIGTGQVDPTQAGETLARNTASLFGKILRLDVTRDGFAADPDRNYAIPSDNPVIGAAGRSEIYVTGLRNPKGISIDAGNLYIGDGSRLLPSSPQYVYRVTTQDAGARLGTDSGSLPPVFTASSRFGTFLTGGIVYRGSSPLLQGRYLYADLGGNLIRSVALVDFVPNGRGNFRDEASGFAVAFAVDQNNSPLALQTDGAGPRISRLVPF